MKRRRVVQSIALAPFLINSKSFNSQDSQNKVSPRMQYSVNAYSFNKQLRSGAMDFYNLMEYAAGIGLDAVDLTGYYFSSYPNTPEDKVLFEHKKKALQLGLDIPWTGIRNDFVNPDKKKRKADRQLIREWLAVSAKLGATIMRVFAGTSKHEGFSREQVKDWMVEDFKVCSEYAAENGVILGLQHHNDFLYTANEVIEIMERVDSDWFGLILDTGSLHAQDPYDEMKKLAPYANYWFIKEHVYPGGKKTAVDMTKVAQVLKESNYRGYISFESLSDGDPKVIVKDMYNRFREVYGV